MRKQGRSVEEDSLLDIETDLKNASVCSIQDNVLTPTLYGLMVFGRDPQSYPYTTSLFVQFAAYDGTDRAADVLSVGEGKGCLEDQVMRSIDWFRSLGRQENFRGLRREDNPLIPEEVLREAVVNAVIHRDYALTGTQVLLEVFSDRIDVTSPGTLPNHMTVEHARSGGAARSRNEMMANAIVVTGLMERRGRGWLLMRKLMWEINGTEPALVNDESGRFVRVTFQLDLDTSG